ncbi:hypothetical protein [Moraxella sp. VT-16-12]|uniref:hypothetical protein n=1 Tax=Moraxella sp. VT-16-12 TaxID=2014877 RepID=UPI000B7F6A4C|nr:hypothetical protein [Moraxella sp. VT-16-12]TWV84005.1 hypothetical protein CEW93_002415 [Moraxella sp. VT-16-12]
MKNEQGAAMIVVLVVLLLIAIAGTIAMRSGVFGSRLATNTQVGNLLINNNDAALTKFEDMDATDIQTNFSPGGMYHYLLEPVNAANELVFCYHSGDADTFGTAKASMISPSGTTSNLAGTTSGFCDASRFSSGRNAVITQVHMKRQDTGADSLVVGSTLNQDVLTTQKTINISLSAISILPAYASSNINPNDIEDCFKKTAFKPATTGTTNESNAECFARLNMPYEIQSTDFRAGNEIVVTRP